MNTRFKLACALALCGFLVYRTTVSTHASRDGFSVPEVSAEGVIVHAGLNAAGDTDPALYGVVEGSVTFMANIPFQKILDNCIKAETLAAISPNVQNLKAVKSAESEAEVTFDVEEDVVPLPGLANVAPAKVFLKFTVNKRALKDRALYVKFELDPSKPNKWKRLSGRIFGVDLNNGYSMLMVSTSSRSHYDALPTLRLKLVKTYLSKTKDHIVGWLNSIRS